MTGGKQLIWIFRCCCLWDFRWVPGVIALQFLVMFHMVFLVMLLLCSKVYVTLGMLCMFPINLDVNSSFNQDSAITLTKKISDTNTLTLTLTLTFFLFLTQPLP